MHEIDSVCRFAALAALPIDVLPDETTILKFRHWLRKTQPARHTAQRCKHPL
ncbi:MAG: hypothetical protein ACXW01_10925 [Methylobacter sp.]